MTVLTETAYPVLIVDDSIEDRATYCRYLSESRTQIYEVTEVDTVMDGLESFAESPPACVLLDYRLPDGNGLEFLDQLASKFPLHDTPIVMMTRFGDEDVVVKALKNGATDYLSKKNITADALCRTVHQVIEKGSLLRSLTLTQERLAHLLETSPAVIYSSRPSGDFGATYISANIEHQMGYVPDDFTQDAGFWADHIHDEDRETGLWWDV